jgi:hypothetical protein
MEECIENVASNNSSLPRGTSLQSRCLATKGEIHFTEPLLSNDRRHTHDRLMGGLYEVHCEMGSAAMLYI